MHTVVCVVRVSMHIGLFACMYAEQSNLALQSPWYNSHLTIKVTLRHSQNITVAV